MSSMAIDPGMIARAQAALGGGDAGGGSAPSADEALDGAIQAIQDYISASDSNDVDTATAAKCLSALQGIKAGHQKETEAAMGTTPAHRAMARTAAASAPAQQGY